MRINDRTNFQRLYYRIDITKLILTQTTIYFICDNVDKLNVNIIFESQFSSLTRLDERREVD